MVQYLLRRTAMTVGVVLLVTLLVALMPHLVPGDPARVILGPKATEKQVAMVRRVMGLDDPVLVRVGKFMWNALRGDLGTDFWTQRPVRDMIGDALPHTIILAVAALSFAALLGIPLGVYSATHPNTVADRLISVVSISLVTIPSYVAGLLLLLFFGVQLRLLPTMGAGDFSNPWDYFRHLVLPATALGISWVGYLARLVRTSLLEVLNTDYIRTARAFGLPDWLVNFKYALKNAIIPTVATLGVSLGSLMGGAVFEEIIFTRPGMGMLIYTGIMTRNYPVVQGGVLVVALLFVAANFLADISYNYLDPRIRREGLR